MQSKNSKGLDILCIGGGKEQEELAREFIKKGYLTAIFGFAGDLSLHTSEASPDSLKCRNLVSIIREYSDPIKFEDVYYEVLKNKNIGLSTFWGDEEIKNLSSEQREHIEHYVKDYKALKDLLQKIYETEERVFDFTTKKTLLLLELSRVTGFLDYNKFTINALSFEIIKEYKKRELSEAEELDDEGYELNQSGRYEEALPYFNRALELSPRFCLAYINKGIALKNLGKLDEAIECYDKVINELNPEYKKAWHNKAVALQKKGKIDEAKNVLIEL